VGVGVQTNTPVQLSQLSNVRQISIQGATPYFLKNDGTVWGLTGETERIPVQVEGLSDITVLASGFIHTLALKEDGCVWAWNGNNVGQLGNGSTEDSIVPVQVSGLSDVQDIAAGMMHSLAVKSDGTVWAWGAGTFGQLGTGQSVMTQNTPVQTNIYPGQSNVVGNFRGNGSMAVSPTGSIWIWGMIKSSFGYDPVHKSDISLFRRLPVTFMTGWGIPADGDADGVPDNRDFCPETAPGTDVNAFGCAVPSGDLNQDGFIDIRDVLPGLKLITAQPQSVEHTSDTNSDGVFGLKDTIYNLRRAGE